MTAEEAIGHAEQWLVRQGQQPRHLRCAYFLWRYDLERWANSFCSHSYQQWKRALRLGPVADRYILVEKWCVVFAPNDQVSAGETDQSVTVEVDDRTAGVRRRDV